MATLVRRKRNRDVEIPTASMADIAFLLLIFFLVTTTIDVDAGISMTLPPEADPESVPPPVQDRNMLSVLVNADGEILVENEFTELDALRGLVVRHLTNNGRDPGFADSPAAAVVSMKTARETTYARYIDVLDELWLGYNDVWDEQAALRDFDSYEAYRAALPAGGRDEIREAFPAQLSIAEPDPAGPLDS